MIDSSIFNKARASNKISDTQEVGIDEFVLHVEITGQSKKSTQVAQFPLEDGSYAADHIIVNPETITMTGVVSQIKVRPNPYSQEAFRAFDVAGQFDGLLPEQSIYRKNQLATLAAKVYDYQAAIDGLIQKAEGVMSLFGDDQESPPVQFYKKMSVLMVSRKPLNIELGFQVYENFVITDLELNEDNQVNDVSFKITAQEMRFAETDVSIIQQVKVASTAKAQTSTQTKKGKQAGTDKDASILEDWFG